MVELKKKFTLLLQMKSHHLSISLITLLLPAFAHAAPFLSAETTLQARFGKDWASLPNDTISSAIVEMAESLPYGGALDLGEVACGTIDLRGIADGIQITGGRQGEIVLGDGQSGISLLFSRLDQRIEATPSQAEWSFVATGMFEKDAKPLSDYLALFCSGGIRIKSDVKNCTWIAGDNAFGDHVVTAEARVDDSLFLWFGINWPFRDFNAHWTDGGKTDWVKRGAQMHFDLKGGGAGTRLYHMVETNYGNPGPGVILENAKGVSLMHGSTERSSAQGPGVYWLKNCENVLLGLRGINAFGSNDGGVRIADANRDITIEGGQGNVLYAMRVWSNSNEVSLWNSDPSLQQWCVASQYGQKGVEDTLRYAVTPYYNRPTAEWLAKFDIKAHAQAIFDKRAAHLAKEWEKRKADAEKKKKPFEEAQPQPHESVDALMAKIKTGRHLNSPGDIDMNATDEETFLLGKTDLTKPKSTGQAAVPVPVPVPAPPDVPPTNAPRTRQIIAFTQQPDFGKALLDAGADPTGKKPSDDAFSQVLYGMNRSDLQNLLAEADAADAAIWAMHGGNEEKLKTARETPEFKAQKAKMAESMNRIMHRKESAKAAAETKMKELSQQIEEAKKAKDNAKKATLEAERDLAEREARSGTVRLDIPQGTFLLKQPLYLLGGISGVWGTGEKSVLKTDAAIQLVKMQDRTTMAQITMEGGSVGLALTGADHHYNEGSPTKKAYVAGENFYALTFRNQTLAGMLVGNDDPELMSGAEHDQNKYVDLRFENTGDYGICMNSSMLDKWLVLHSSFSGQKKAGIAVKFNNLIHGMIVGSRFENIDGPGVDTFGGNVEIGYRPWEVWVDECEFIECGSLTQPAVEMGITELSAFTHNTISTKQKTIACGFAGSPQIFEDCKIDVQLADNAPAVKLRAVRTESVVRANGHVIRNVQANGGLSFVNDANSQQAHFAKTIARLTAHGKPHVTKWDTNTMTTTHAPKNGWVHPFLFYKTSIGKEKFSYSLLNVDVDAGKVKERIELGAD